MPEFLAETYAPPGAPAADTAGRVSGPGAPVRLLGAILVPEEETCFYLYRAPSAAAVRAAMTRGRLRPDRITPAAWIRPPRRAVTSPGPAAAAPPAAPAADRGP